MIYYYHAVPTTSDDTRALEDNISELEIEEQPAARPRWPKMAAVTICAAAAAVVAL